MVFNVAKVQNLFFNNVIAFASCFLSIKNFLVGWLCSIILESFAFLSAQTRKMIEQSEIKSKSKRLQLSQVKTYIEISPEGAIDHRQWCSEAKPLHTYQPINESPEGAKERLQLCVIVLLPLRG